MGLIYIPNYMKALRLYGEGEFYISEVNKRLRIGGTNVSHINKMFEDLGIIKYVEGDSKKKYIVLTEKGKEVRNYINNIIDVLQIPKEETDLKIVIKEKKKVNNEVVENAKQE